MATDIVVQLRMLATCMERGYGMSTVYGAADEIERLRKECGLWEKTALALAESLGKRSYAFAEYENQQEELE